ncbi:hypothetical protein HPB51_008629 [Rhipicephalus microplus]|uniref:Uncharacterized protein n=1 Tax=Rhipicephalus microplus TaxID=6941 RepID=A0A9J6EN30_RHIMP|nr:hypothetical protein HPB51_008629 [Rhipicephalus microplus]
MQQPQSGFDPATCGSEAEYFSHQTTAAGPCRMQASTAGLEWLAGLRWRDLRLCCPKIFIPWKWLSVLSFLSMLLFFTGQNCFGGIESFEKTTGLAFSGSVSGQTLLQQPDQALTRDCINLCKQQAQCLAFSLNYVGFRCASFNLNSIGRRDLLVATPSTNYFEKICFRGVQKSSFDALCGDRLWAFERVKEGHLEGFVDREEHNVKDKEECEKMCLLEEAFPCRSADYDEVAKTCRMSREDRRSQPQAFRQVPGSTRDYLENQCSATEQCTLGVFTYEKMTGFVMRSAARTAIPLSSPGALGNTLECRQFCQMSGLDCPAFSVNYQNMRCDKLDRNSQGRTQELSPRAGENYFEKICLRGNFATACQGKAWAFERVLGLELVPTLYDKSFAHVQSRRDCEEYCLNEQTFDCRSAVYFDDTAECRLSRHDRRTQPDGVIKSSSPRINYLENQCLEVSPTCPYEKTADAYPVYTDVVQMTGIISEQSCESFCTTYPNFNCRSFAYYPSNGQCFISGDDRISAGPASTNSRPGILFYERSCKDGVGVTDGGSGTTAAGGGTSSSTGATSSSPTFPTAQPPHTPTLFPPTVRHCSAGEKLSFARVSGHESASRPGPILLTAPADGMTKECILRCEQRDDCHSFSIDYRRHECYIAGYYSGSLPAHLRPSPGKTYFEGICVPGKENARPNEFEKLGVPVRCLQTARGADPREATRFITLHDCERRCFEERRFPCKSASYDVNLQECRLYADDRNSRFARLIYGRGVYYLENQCTVNTSPCPYAPIQRDVYMTHITRVVHGVSSTFHCEMECNREPDFNCRSYTYVEHGTLGPPQCLLSADSRPGVSPIVLEYRSRALYAEKDCHMDDESRNNGVVGGTSHPPPYPHTPPSPPHRPPPGDYSPYPPPRFCTYEQYTYEKTIGHDMRYAPRERIPTRSAVGVVRDAYTECQRLGDRCRAFVIEYGNFQSASWLSTAAEDNRQLLSANPVMAYFEKICLQEPTCGKMWSFERTVGHTLGGDADREVPGVLRRAQCEDLCLRERTFVCRSATYQQSRLLCRLHAENRRTRPALYARTAEDVDYLENTCAPEPSTCQYREHVDRFLPIIDRLGHAFSLAECQRQCDLERLFSCRAVNFETVHRDCALSSEDAHSTPLGTAALAYRRYSVYSEKGTCEQVSVQCNQQDMLLAMNFDTPFHGRVYAKGNPSQCFVVGNGQNTLQFAVSLGTRCGTLTEGDGRYANEVVVQQHPIIMTDTDRNIRVVCSFEAGDRTVTLGSSFARNGAYSGGLDVTTRHQPTITSVVTNTAPPPNVVMRILDPSGRDAGVVGLGDELTLRIEIQEPGSAFAIFARNLYARSSNGESLFLIDSLGCPVDPTIFPPLRPDYRQPGALFANFKAFRFPSSGLVNFEVQIRFCQDRCDPVHCQGGGESFGRRRRDVSFPPLARYAFGNRTRPIFLKAHKPTIVIRPYAVRTTASPATTSTNEPPVTTTATQAPETTTVEPATTTTTFTEDTLTTQTESLAETTTASPESTTDDASTTAGAPVENTTDAVTQEPPQNVTFAEEAAEETVATTLTSFPDTNETLRFDSEEVDGDAYDDAEESEPHLMFRKQEMYLPEEGNASSPEVQEPRKEGDKIEQVSSAVVFRNPDSSGPQVQRGPSQQATAVPFDLTSQPYGGYGLGYGRHYDSPPPPPYGGQSPYGHGGYYEDRVSQTYADARHGMPPHATQSFSHGWREIPYGPPPRPVAIEPGAERHRYENRRLERPDHRGSAGNEQKKELSGNRGLHYYEAAGHHREFNRTTDRVNASLWQTRSDLASGRESQKPGLEADSTGHIRESVNGDDGSFRGEQRERTANQYNNGTRPRDNSWHGALHSPTAERKSDALNFSPGNNETKATLSLADSEDNALFQHHQQQQQQQQQMTTNSSGQFVVREMEGGYGGPSSALREIVATTEKPYPEEVPLSLAIMVGEDSGGGGGKPHNSWARNAATNSGGGVYQPPRSRKREPPLPRPVEEEPACDPQNTIIITALVVSAIHVGLMLGGFFCFRWQRRSMKRKQLIASVMGDFRMPSGAGVTSAAMPAVHHATTSAAAPGRSHYSPASPSRVPGGPMVYGKADTSFRQMYSDFETPP